MSGVEIREAGYLEYCIAFAALRTALADFYLRNQPDACGLLGAYEGGRPRGYLLYRGADDSLEILQLQAEEEAEEISRALLLAAAEKGRKHGFSQVLFRLTEGRKNYEWMKGLLERTGFSIEARSEIFRSLPERKEAWRAYQEKHGRAVLGLLEEQGFVPVPFSQAPESAIAAICERRMGGFEGILNPGELLRGRKGRVCLDISYLSLKEGEPAAYCLVSQPDPDHYIFEIIAAAVKYQNTGVIFQPFACSSDQVSRRPYRSLEFCMYRDNRKAIALTGRMMKALISSRESQYSYVYHL